MAVELYKHNLEAYEAARALLEREGRAAVVHPTGSGKSFIAFRFCEDNPDKKFLWLAPSEYIFSMQKENLVASGAAVPENIRYCTYTRLTRFTEEDFEATGADFIILDEFHRCGAEVWERCVRKLIEANPEAKILGLSATSIRYLDGMRNMSDELFCGNVASEISLAEAVVRGILSPPKYVLTSYALNDNLKKYAEKFERVKNTELRSRASRYMEKLKRVLERSEGLENVFFRHIENRSGKFIVFCSRYSHMLEMMDKVASWFSKVDPEPHVYYTYSYFGDSRDTFEAFKDDRSSHLKLLFCIDMLNEGVHIADVEGVILLRPTVSPIIYKQQIGRALSADSTSIPTVFDIVMNVDNLCSIDELSGEIEELVEYYRESGNDDLIVNRHFVITDELRDCRKLFRQLDEMLHPTWDVMFECAKRYYEEYGNLLVRNDFRTPEGYTLGHWISHQRAIYNNSGHGFLTAEQIDRLNSIGMNWTWWKETMWENNFKLAKKFYEQNGHLTVPRGYVAEDGSSTLFSWVRRQRNVYRGTERGIITQEQIERLETIGMCWHPDRDAIWNKHFEDARNHYLEHGNLLLSVHDEDPKKRELARWLSDMRNKNNKNNSKFISEEKIQKLNSIGMVWDTFDYNWEKNYRLLLDYYEKHGNIDVPYDYVCENGMRLGSWISSMRGTYKGYCKARLTPERIEKLNALGMNWKMLSRSWDDYYCEAEKYYEIHGNLNMKSSYVTQDGCKLGMWIYRQRYGYGTKLSRERTEKLNRLGMIWEILEIPDSWDEHFELAEQYYTDHGNLDIPHSYTVSGFGLGKWLYAQKKKYNAKKGRAQLTPGQIKKLESIGVVWPEKIPASEYFSC